MVYVTTFVCSLRGANNETALLVEKGENYAGNYPVDFSSAAVGI